MKTVTFQVPDDVVVTRVDYFHGVGKYVDSAPFTVSPLPETDKAKFLRLIAIGLKYNDQAHDAMRILADAVWPDKP